MGDGVEMMEKEPRSKGRQLLHDFGDPQYCPLSPEIDHNYDVPEGRFAFSSPVQGRNQLKALHRRQYLQKSVEEHFHAETFVNQTLLLSSLLKQELLSNSKSLLQLCPPSLLTQQRLSVEELDVLVDFMQQEVAQGFGKAIAFRNLARNLTHANKLLPSESPLGAFSLKCMESAMQVSNIITTFNAYNGPLPMPSFDAFVQVLKLLQRTLSTEQGTQK